MKKIIAALAGNPNSGKTSIFNMLTGARQHVGNYPGVTVEKKEGICHYKDYEITFVDLPGTYALSGYSEDEIVTRNFIIDEKPDVVVDILDASSIERNLYLATQLIEMNKPLVLVFNMSDIAERNGLIFDTAQLSSLLETPIVQTVGSRSKGKIELLEVIINTVFSTSAVVSPEINYGDEIEKAINDISAILAKNEPHLTANYNTRWLAIKMLEQDADIVTKIKNPETLSFASRVISDIEKFLGDKPEIILADRRYGFISGACQETIKQTVEQRHSKSDMIDAIVIHNIFGLPIFLGFMYIVFVLTFRIGRYPMHWLEKLFDYGAVLINNVWPADTALWLNSLIIDGIIAGVGGVAVFLPNILLLFFAIAMLEDTGYMARAAFVTDRFMHKMGLHGKSFIPMLIGFGCSVPP